MSRDHYVSRFHLQEFCDQESLDTPDPWVWVGSIHDASVRRRSPKNIATEKDLFSGPGGLANGSIEKFLATEVESSAAFAIRRMAEGTLNPLPTELMRYLAWAASRSLPMRRLHTQWVERFPPAKAELVEEPPIGLSTAATRQRPVRMLHPEGGSRVVGENEDPTPLLDDGWYPDPSEPDNFLEAVHIQAYYLQVRWFPRLKWFALRPPDGEHFIIGDRPVGWGVPTSLDAPPSCLRDPDAFLIAPLSRGLALIGRNSARPWSVSAGDINAILALWAHDWIAGPSSAVVKQALLDRERHIQ